MALKPCKECRREISDRVQKCPSCGAKQRMGCVGKGIIGVIVLMAGSAAIQNYAESPKTPEELHADSLRMQLFGARLLCQRRAMALLRSPTTAQFQDPGAGFGEVLPHKHFHVQTYVDAQNGFGAMMRTRFDCRVAQIGSTYVLLKFKPLD